MCFLKLLDKKYSRNNPADILRYIHSLFSKTKTKLIKLTQKAIFYQFISERELQYNDNFIIT